MSMWCCCVLGGGLSQLTTCFSACRVVFTGSQDGEFWYKLDLIMLEPKPVVMPQVVCEIGR